MPRKRDIAYTTFTNEDLNSLPFAARWLFVGMWTIADRDGRLIDRPKRIRAQVMPYDNDDADVLLTLLVDAKFITRYTVESDGVEPLKVIQINNFKKYQNCHPGEAASQLPAASTSGSAATKRGKARLRRDKGVTKNALTSFTSIPSSTSLKRADPSVPDSPPVVEVVEELPVEKPESMHVAFVMVFTGAWLTKYQTPYPFNAGKDGASIKWMREQLTDDVQRWREVIERYLGNDDPFYNGHPLGTLRAQFARFIVRSVPAAAPANNFHKPSMREIITKRLEATQ